MKKILFLLLLAASLVAAQNCPQGHLRIDGACQPISYIPGCTLYTKSGRCSLC